MILFDLIFLLNVQIMKSCAQICNRIYHCNIYQPPLLSLKGRHVDHFPILFSLHWNQVRLIDLIWRINNISFSYCQLCIYNKNIYYGNRSKLYIQSYNGELTRWRHHANTRFHNPINEVFNIVHTAGCPISCDYISWTHTSS